MKLYEFREIPKHTEKLLVGYQCDWCKNKIKDVELPTVSEFLIKDEVGTAYSDGGGYSNIKTFDLCMNCRLNFWDFIKRKTDIRVQIEEINV